MIKIQTKFFGEVEVNEEKIIFYGRMRFYFFPCRCHTRKFGRFSSFGIKSLNSSLVSTRGRILRLI